MRPRLVALPLVLLGLAAPAGAAAADAQVSFRSNLYEPRDVRIAVGESVTWTPEAGSSFDSHPLASATAGETYERLSGTTAFSHTFSKAGTFRYYCTVHGTQDGQGMAGTVTVGTAAAANAAPVAAFAVDASRVGSGTLAFDAAGSSDPDAGQALTYAWDFGDGASQAASSSPAAAHSYAPGSFVVTLTVRDPGAASATTTRQVTVPAADPNAPRGGISETAAGAPPPPSPSPSPKLTLARLGGLGALLRGGLRVGVRSAAAGRVSARLRVGGRTVATAAAATVAPGTRRTVRLRFTRAARSALARRRGRLTGRLEVTLTTASGSRATTTRTVRLQ